MSFKFVTVVHFVPRCLSRGALSPLSGLKLPPQSVISDTGRLIIAEYRHWGWGTGGGVGLPDYKRKKRIYLWREEAWLELKMSFTSSHCEQQQLMVHSKYRWAKIGFTQKVGFMVVYRPPVAGRAVHTVGRMAVKPCSWWRGNAARRWAKLQVPFWIYSQKSNSLKVIKIFSWTTYFIARLIDFHSNWTLFVCLFGRERHPMRRRTQSERRATLVRSFSLTVASCCGIFSLHPTLGSISHLT